MAVCFRITAEPLNGDKAKRVTIYLSAEFKKEPKIITRGSDGKEKIQFSITRDASYVIAADEDSVDYEKVFKLRESITGENIAIDVAKGYISVIGIEAIASLRELSCA